MSQCTFHLFTALMNCLVVYLKIPSGGIFSALKEFEAAPEVYRDSGANEPDKPSQPRLPYFPSANTSNASQVSIWTTINRNQAAAGRIQGGVETFIWERAALCQGRDDNYPESSGI